MAHRKAPLGERVKFRNVFNQHRDQLRLQDRQLHTRARQHKHDPKPVRTPRHGAEAQVHRPYAALAEVTQGQSVIQGDGG